MPLLLLLLLQLPWMERGGGGGDGTALPESPGIVTGIIPFNLYPCHWHSILGYQSAGHLR